MLRQQEDANSLLARRFRSRDRLHPLRRAENKAQYKFSDQMLDLIQEALEYMMRNTDEGFNNNA